MVTHFQPLETRALLSAAVSNVTVNGFAFKGIVSGDGGERLLIPRNPKLVKPAAADKLANAALSAALTAPNANANAETGFLITLNFSGSGVTDAIRNTFNAAAAKWMKIIKGNAIDPPAVHNVTISASIAPIDGVGKILGQAGPTSLKSTSYLPIAGQMQFDSADLNSLLSGGGLSDVIFHEMGHVLGVGTIWGYKKLSGGTSADPRFLGQNAIAAYRALGASDTTVPLENVGGAGTVGAHWRESVFNNEIMTGYLNAGINPVSSLTIASMIDLGWSVDPSQAEQYTVPGLTPTGANASISGTVFTDTNRNGSRDDGEPVAAGRVVYIDSNGNGRLDTGERAATTRTDGGYSFINLAPGSYTVRVNATGTLTQTTTSAAVTVGAGENATGQDFGTFDSAASVSGKAFLDRNKSGSFDSGDSPLSRATVFLDTNNNGRPDAGERFTSTAVDGSYSFNNLTPGDYRVRLLLSGNLSQLSGVNVSLEAGQNRTDNNLAAFDSSAQLLGTVFLDANKNGSRDAGESLLPGRTVFLDTNNNGRLDAGERAAVTNSAGTYAFINIPANTYNVRVLLTADSTLVSTIDSFSTEVPAAQTTYADRGLFETAGSIAGTVFTDLDRDGARSDGEAGIPSRVVYLDTNSNGRLDTGERFTAANAQGAFSFLGVRPGTYTPRTVLPSTLVLQTSTNSVTVDTAQAVTGVNVGTFDTTTSVSGTVFSDTDKDGTRDDGEPYLAKTTVYVDTNNNGRPDAGERTALTAADGSFTILGLAPGTYKLRAVLPANVAQLADVEVTTEPGQKLTGASIATFDSNTSISGNVFIDANRNGTRDTNEIPLRGGRVYLDRNGNGAFDAADLSVLTDVNGNYTFTNLAPASYTVRIVRPVNFVQLTPENNGIYTLTLDPAARSTGNNFSIYNNTGTLLGTVFNDVNKNGSRDTNEPGLASRVVYLDTNGNGAYDKGEPVAISNAVGNYAFANVPSGAYTLRTLTVTTLTQTLPAAAAGQSVTINPGETTTASLFGLASNSALRLRKAAIFSSTPLAG